jgi:hypothetical protein
LRKISLAPYQIDSGEEYDVKKTLTLMLFLPSLKLGARDLIENDKIATKIESCTDMVLLEESEYAKLKMAFEIFEGYSRNDAEVVDRVLNAPEVPVKEA